MDAKEVLQLCRLVKACCPSQALDQFTPEAWGLILGSYDYADAKAAVANLVSLPLEPGKSRYIEPGHIIAGIHRIRRQRLDSTPMPEPPAGLTAGEYIAWQATTQQAIMAGTYQPAPTPAAIAAPERLSRAIEQATPRPAETQPDPEPAKPRMTEAELDAERARQLAALETITEGA